MRALFFFKKNQMGSRVITTHNLYGWINNEDAGEEFVKCLRIKNWEQIKEET